MPDVPHTYFLGFPGPIVLNVPDSSLVDHVILAESSTEVVWSPNRVDKSNILILSPTSISFSSSSPISADRGHRFRLKKPKSHMMTFGDGNLTIDVLDDMDRRLCQVTFATVYVPILPFP